MVFELNLAKETGFNLQQTHVFASFHSHPTCDRLAKHRAGAKRHHTDDALNKEKGSTTTQPVSLSFSPVSDPPPTLTPKNIGEESASCHPSFQLIGLIETLIGRERGRRDIVVYGRIPGVRVCKREDEVRSSR